MGLSRSYPPAVRPAHEPIAGLEVTLEVADLIDSVGRKFAEAAMTTTPVQPRARGTVNRIVGAAVRLGFSNSGEPPSLQDVAGAANLRLGAVYRYFSSPGDLVRTIVRLWTVKKFDQYRARLARMSFATYAELADDMADCVSRLLADDLAEPDIPVRIKLILMRDYHETPYAELSALAGDVLAAAARGGLDINHGGMQPRLAMAFGAASGFVRMTYLQAPQLRGSAYVRETLRGYFLASFDGSGLFRQ